VRKANALADLLRVDEAIAIVEHLKQSESNDDFKDVILTLEARLDGEKGALEAVPLDSIERLKV
jgi:hypothetical protein